MDRSASSESARQRLARKARTAVRAGVAALQSGLHRSYHTLVPYRQRIILYDYRVRQVRRLKQQLQARDRQRIRRGSVELRDILDLHCDVEGVILFLPSVEWDTTLFQRPHQMAQAFAALGYLVLYWVPVDSSDNVACFRQISDRLYLCNVAPAVMRLLDRPIVIAYTYNYGWASQLRSPRIVYELIDHLEIFTTHPLPLLQHYHRRLLHRAEVVVGTSDDLVNELRRSRSDAVLVPNGVDIHHFAAGANTTTEPPSDMQPITAEGKPVVGYYGALAKWFDHALLKQVARALPEYNFVLIGPDYDGLTVSSWGLESMPNVHWLGAKAYRDLPAYLHAFDVATIPFETSEALQAVSPIKLFEYMAGGRPIVTSDLAECCKYPVVLLSRTAEEWVEQLRDAVRLRHDPAYRAELRRYAEMNTWGQRAHTILDALHVREAPPDLLASSAL